jgi:hypothetical protein
VRRPSFVQLVVLAVSGGGLAQAQPAPAASVPSATPPSAAPFASSASPRPAADPRELFGLPARSKPAFGCATRDQRSDAECALSQDPLEQRSPLAITTWLDGTRLARLPVADATHDSQAAAVLGVGSDDGGVVIGGASSLENRWTVEGAPVDSVRSSGAETRIPLPFLAGVRVSTGGFSARDRSSSGGVIDAELLRGGTTHIIKSYTWAGLQTERRDRPVLPGTYSALRGRVVDPQTATVAVVASGPVISALGGRAWYAVGIAPNVTDISLQRTGLRLVDRNNDGNVDLGTDGGFVTEPVSRDTFDTTAVNVPLMARIGLERPGQAVELSLVGQWAKSARFTSVATPEAVVVDRRALILDGIATWRRRWAHTALRAQLAWHHSARDEQAGRDGANDVPQIQTAFVPRSDDIPQADSRFLAACRDDADDLYPNIPNCPVPTGWFARDGVGLLTDVATDRPSFSFDAVHELSGHALRIGATSEDARMVISSRYSGGSLTRILFPGHLDRSWFVDPREVGPCSMDIDLPCPTLSRSELTYRTRQLGAYVEDTWRPRPDLLIDLGVRWEYQQLGTRLKFARGLAPRGGVAWDPLGGGRSRVAVTFARSFAALPAGLGERIDKSPSNVREIDTGIGRSRVIEYGAAAKVLADVAPMITDEATFSAEVAWPQLGQLRVHSQHRWLRSGFEDTLEGFGNPGAANLGSSGSRPARRLCVWDSARLAGRCL